MKIRLGIRNRSVGFTVVELMAVITVIAILVVISVVGYNGVTQRAQDNSVLSDIKSVEAEVARYITQNSQSAFPSISWFSEDGASSEISFTPSQGTVVDVVSAAGQYCIRAFNPSSNFQTIQLAASKGSSETACQLMDASVSAGGSGGSIQGWYKLNGNAADSSGNNRNGTVSGAVPGVGQNGDATGAYVFSDTVLQGIDTGYNFPFNRITAAAWIRPSGFSPNSFATILSNARDCCSTYNGIHMQYSKTAPYPITSRLWWGTTSQSAISYSGLTLNAWQHVAVTFDGTTHRLYVNGAQVSQANPPTTTLGSSIYNIFIGRGGWTNGYSFGGSIDDVRIYDYALSANDIMNLFESGAE